MSSSLPILSPGQKADLVRRMLAGASLRAGLEKVSAEELVAAFRFIYEKTIELGQLAYGGSFPQEELLHTGRPFHLPPAVDCRQAHICQPLECLHRQPDCARDRILLQIDRLSGLARTLLQSAPTAAGEQP